MLVRTGRRHRAGRTAQELVGAVRAALEPGIELQTLSIPMGAHTGFAVFGVDGESAAALIYAARRAMESGRGPR